MDDTRPTNLDDEPNGWYLLSALGDHPKTRILAALLTNADMAFSLSDVALMAATDRSTVSEHLPALVAQDIVIEALKDDETPLYQINKESAAAESLARFEWDLIKADAEREHEYDAAA